MSVGTSYYLRSGFSIPHQGSDGRLIDDDMVHTVYSSLQELYMQEAVEDGQAALKILYEACAHLYKTARLRQPPSPKGEGLKDN